MESERQREKRRLVLECACDRLNWKVNRLRAQRRHRGADVLYWLNQVNRLAGPFLPRWWRTGYAVFRRWSS